MNIEHWTRGDKLMCTTSIEAYDIAKQLCAEHQGRLKAEHEANVRSNVTEQKKKVPPEDGPSRTVTEIDYQKHEQFVKTVERQEEEEEFNRKKEEAALWCPLDHEHGPNCRHPMHGCSHNHQKEWAIYEKSTQEKVNAANRFREEGNEAYRKKNFGLAAVIYRKALLQFDYATPGTEEEQNLVDDAKLPCLLNFAACKCQLEDWEEVLTQCRLALEINPRSVKAFYRTGVARLAQDRFELARAALLNAQEIEPKNPEVLAALEQLKTKVANYKIKRKEICTQMLSGHNPGESSDMHNESASKEETQTVQCTKMENDTCERSMPHIEVGKSTQEPSSHSADERDVSEVNGLRQRCGVRTPEPTKTQEEKDYDEDGDEDAGEDDRVEGVALLSPSQQRLLNGIMVIAIALGLVPLTWGILKSVS